jgi:hypothetical protein
MANLPKAYIRIARDITGYWGTYLPSVTIAPGMLGPRVDGAFVRESDIRHCKGFDPKNHAVQEQPDGDPVNFWTTKNVATEVLGVDADVKVAKAGVKLRFNGANEAAIVCYGARLSSFVDLRSIKDLMWQLLREDSWDKAHCLVTEVWTVDSAFICFATERGQEAEIGASVPFVLPVLPLAALASLGGKATLSASASGSQMAGFYAQLSSGATPLFRAIRFRQGWLDPAPTGIEYFTKAPDTHFEEVEFGDEVST